MVLLNFLVALVFVSAERDLRLGASTFNATESTNYLLRAVNFPIFTFSTCLKISLFSINILLLFDSPIYSHVYLICMKKKKKAKIVFNSMIMPF